MMSCLALQDVVTELQDCGEVGTPVSLSNDPGKEYSTVGFSNSGTCSIEIFTMYIKIVQISILNLSSLILRWKCHSTGM